jgi:drug/metabolite transporter (DMT)-like permease
LSETSLTPKDARIGLILVLGSAIAYGTMPILAKLAYARGVAPAALLAFRFTIAAAVFGGLGRDQAALPLATRVRLWAIGLVFVGNACAYFGALETVPASVLALLLYAYPVIVTLLSALLGLDPLTRRGLLAVVLTFSGTSLTAGAAAARTDTRGIALAFSAALLYSCYIVLGSRFAARVPSEAAARHVAQVCVACFVPWAAASGTLQLPKDPTGWAAVVAIALLCTVFALRAFLAGLARIGPARAAVASAFEVVVTVVLAVAVLHERVGPQQWLGAALILGGVWLQNFAPR